MESQPFSRTGENSPYGMIGGIEETAASFEARSAPRSYPTGAAVLGKFILRCEFSCAARTRIDETTIELPGVREGGMSGRRRKPGTTRGSLRRSRTAKASRISRHAVKSRCAREWDGWGRLSDEGPGHYNLDPSEGPWGKAVHYRVHGPTPCGIMV